MRKTEEKSAQIIMKIAAFIVFFMPAAIFLFIACKGISALYSSSPSAPVSGGCGVLNAAAGTLCMSICSTAIAFFAAFLCAVYLNIYLRKNSRRAFFIRLTLDLLCGIPAIIYGACAVTIMIYFHIHASLLAAIITVAFLVCPVIARSLDESFLTLPDELLESSYALGSTRFETVFYAIWHFLKPKAVTAFLLGFGRAAGNAAAVMLTAGYTDNMPSLFEPAATLPLAVFYQLSSPFTSVQNQGYLSAFTLLIIVLSTSMIARLYSRKETI